MRHDLFLTFPAQLQELYTLLSRGFVKQLKPTTWPALWARVASLLSLLLMVEQNYLIMCLMYPSSAVVLGDYVP